MVDHEETFVCLLNECPKDETPRAERAKCSHHRCVLRKVVAWLRDFDALDSARSSKTVAILQVQYHDCVAPVSDRTTIVRILYD